MLSGRGLYAAVLVGNPNYPLIATAGDQLSGPVVMAVLLVEDDDLQESSRSWSWASLSRQDSITG